MKTSCISRSDDDGGHDDLVFSMMINMNLDLSIITSRIVAKAPLTGDLRAIVSSSVDLITSST